MRFLIITRYVTWQRLICKFFYTNQTEGKEKIIGTCRGPELTEEELLLCKVRYNFWKQVFHPFLN